MLPITPRPLLNTQNSGLELGGCITKWFLCVAPVLLFPPWKMMGQGQDKVLHVVADVTVAGTSAAGAAPQYGMENASGPCLLQLNPDLWGWCWAASLSAGPYCFCSSGLLLADTNTPPHARTQPWYVKNPLLPTCYNGNAPDTMNHQLGQRLQNQFCYFDETFKDLTNENRKRNSRNRDPSCWTYSGSVQFVLTLIIVSVFFLMFACFNSSLLQRFHRADVMRYLKGVLPFGLTYRMNPKDPPGLLRPRYQTVSEDGVFWTFPMFEPLS